MTTGIFVSQRLLRFAALGTALAVSACSPGTLLAPTPPGAAAPSSAGRVMHPRDVTRGIGNGFTTPQGVAVDKLGNVYVADTGNNAVKKVTPGGNTSTLGSGFKAPDAVAVDATGNVFV